MNKIFTQKKHAATNLKISTEVKVEPFNPNEIPSDTIIRNILNYSKALKIEKSKNIDHIELVLN
jgi:hypothetical protein